MAKKEGRNILAWIMGLSSLVYLVFFIVIIAIFTLGGTEFGNVAVIPIDGTIMSKGVTTFSSTITSADTVNKFIRQAEEDDAIKAIVLEINSPGGSAVGSDEIARMVKNTSKPTVAWIREVGASGGYWIASSTDHVIANRMTITGSIGVIGSYLEFGGLLKDYNITYERLVAGERKDIGTPLRELKPEERELFQKVLDSLHSEFITEVAENRNLSVTHVEELATGMFYTGSEAKELGLVDQLGSKIDVKDYLEEELNTTVTFKHYRKKPGLFGSLSGVIADHGFSMGEGFASGLRGNGVTIRT